MSTPEFILALRESVGTMPLWLSGVTAVVLRTDAVRGDEVLMVRRADTLAWTPVTGIIDPGEHPAVAARREVLEEAAIVCEVERLASVGVTDPLVYPNGDRAQYLDYTFVCRWLSGEPFPADGENVDARWFPRTALPPVSADMARRLDAGLSDEVAARFVS